MFVTNRFARFQNCHQYKKNYHKSFQTIVVVLKVHLIYPKLSFYTNLLHLINLPSFQQQEDYHKLSSILQHFYNVVKHIMLLLKKRQKHIVAYEIKIILYQTLYFELYCWYTFLLKKSSILKVVVYIKYLEQFNTNKGHLEYSQLYELTIQQLQLLIHMKNKLCYNL